MRFFNLLLFSMLRSTCTNAYWVTATLVIVITLTLVAKFQPYKRKRTNTVDITMLLTLITGLVSVALRRTSALQYPRLVFDVTLSAVALLPPSYVVCLAVGHTKPKISRCLRRIKRIFVETLNQCPLEEGSDDVTLLNEENVNYNTFPSCTTTDIVSFQ